MILKKLLIISLSISCLNATVLSARMEPIKKDGRYYYSPNDTHEHIDLTRALSFLKRKMLNPSEIIQSIAAFFYTPKQEPLDAIGMLNPMQSVPDSMSIAPQITWIGHSTFLIQINGFNILTDPIFGPVKVGPFTLTKRAMPPGIKFEDLPHIDAIVISHNHSDHTDTTALMALSKKYKSIVFVPEGNKKLMESMGFKRVVESTWWDKTDMIKGDRKVTISCLPALHWSIRFSLSSYRTSLWAGWMIGTEDTHIYFAGDTAYGPHFKDIAQEFPSIDVALMPIGPTHEGENMHKHCHTDALEAIDAFINLNAHTFVPMHYGTFFLGKDTLVHPINRLHTYWNEKKDKLLNKQLLLARCGEQYSV